jgi:hypothetical protein
MKKLIARILKLEHRKHRRFKVYDAALVLFDPTIGEGEEIIDLSMGGVSFSYIDDGKRLSDVFELDIHATDDFHLGKVKVKTVSETVMCELVHQSKVIRRIGGKFESLSPVQEYDLKKFLDAYTNK